MDLERRDTLDYTKRWPKASPPSAKNLVPIGGALTEVPQMLEGFHADRSPTFWPGHETFGHGPILWRRRFRRWSSRSLSGPRRSRHQSSGLSDPLSQLIVTAWLSSDTSQEEKNHPDLTVYCSNVREPHDRANRISNGQLVDDVFDRWGPGYSRSASSQVTELARARINRCPYCRPALVSEMTAFPSKA